MVGELVHEADLVPDLVRELLPAVVGHVLPERDGRHAPRLRAQHHLAAEEGFGSPALKVFSKGF